MLTGRYLMGHRVVNNGTPLTAELATLPRLMTDAGYDPVLFGYTDTTLDPRLLTANDPGAPAGSSRCRASGRALPPTTTSASTSTPPPPPGWSG